MTSSTDQTQKADDLREQLRRLRQHARRQENLAELALLALDEDLSVQNLMERAVERLAQALEVEFVKILQLAPDRETFRLCVGVGWSEGVVGSAILPNDPTFEPGYALRAAAPVRVGDLPQETRFQAPDLLIEHGVRSGLSAAIRGTDEVPWGVLGVHTRRYRDFDADEAQFVEAVAHVLGETIRRHVSQRTLREREEYFRRAVVEAPFPVMIRAEDGEVLQVSRGWTDYSGYRQEDIPTTDDWLKSAHGGEFLNFAHRLPDFFNVHHRPDFAEVPILTRSGDERIWRFSVAPLGREENGRRLFMTMAVDVTDLKEVEQTLQRAMSDAEALSEAKSAFMAAVSHDIRTPLSTILGFAHLLRQEPLTEEGHEHAHSIIESVESLRGTLDSVLDYVRIENRIAPPLNLEPRELCLDIENAVGMFNFSAREKGLTLQTKVPQSMVWAVVDENAINRILSNLIGNAIKYTQEGEVTVEVDETAEHALIRVRDTGIGIEPEHIHSIFDTFHRVPGPFNTLEGHGLGLAITRHLVESMNGAITVESTPGVGTVFTVRLPALSPDQRDAMGLFELPPIEKPPLEFIESSDAEILPRLLVVEDNRSTRKMFSRLLRTRFEVLMAATVDEALELARKEPFDLLLTDISLSEDRTGVDLLHEIRRIPGLRRIPAIACTAHASRQDEKRFLSAGFDMFIAKPFDPPSLVRRIEQCLGLVEA